MSRTTGMKAGPLNLRVNILSKIRVSDGQGGFTTSWVPWATGVPAAVEPLSGQELFLAGGLQGEVQYRIRVRFRPSRPFSRTDRVQWENHSLEITGVIDMLGAHDEVQLMCKELEAS